MYSATLAHEILSGCALDVQVQLYRYKPCRHKLEASLCPLLIARKLNILHARDCCVTPHVDPTFEDRPLNFTLPLIVRDVPQLLLDPII